MIETGKTEPGERLAKVIARAGLCSRRDAEGWITAGRVAVNGELVRSAAFNVTPRDAVAVDGKPLALREPTGLWLYHKPAGLMVTEKDPEGRPTVFEALARLGLPRVLTVGRLDFTTEGLLLLTNDGGLKRILELPSTGWVRRYRVRAYGRTAQADLDSLKNGVSVEGVDYGPIEAVLDSTKGDNLWMTLALREGKNREVRKVLSTLGLEVNRLIRISYGPFQLGDLPAGAVEKVKDRVLKDQLGTRLAEKAKVDFPERDGTAPAGPRRRLPEPEPRRAPERNRFGGPPVLRPVRDRQAPAAESERTLHFSDGRPSEQFVPPSKPRARSAGGETRPGEQPRFKSAPGGKPPRKGPGESRFKDDRPAGDRPGKPGPGKPRFKGAERPEGERRPSGPRKPSGPSRFASADRPGGERPGKPGPGESRFKDDRPGGDRPGKPRFKGAERPEGERRPSGPRKPSGPSRFGGEERRGGPARGKPGGGRPKGGETRGRSEGDRPKGPRRPGPKR